MSHPSTLGFWRKSELAHFVINGMKSPSQGGSVLDTWDFSTFHQDHRWISQFGQAIYWSLCLWGRRVQKSWWVAGISVASKKSIESRSRAVKFDDAETIFSGNLFWLAFQKRTRQQTPEVEIHFWAPEGLLCEPKNFWVILGVCPSQISHISLTKTEAKKSVM